ncbi:calpain-B isoform X1 [Anabrus simplex]|uniref:calpain-B isoform X1 n=1 Tax=Anabrus simplex TaxID=316456 RepID=UPI0035A2A8D6
MERMDAWLTNAVPQREEMEGESQAKQSFFAIAGENKEVDWQGLKEILDYTLRSELKRNEFSKDICRSLVAMKDDDRSGKLRYEEFKCLWREIRDWKTVYKMFVKDGSGFISACDLRKALNSAGYRLNNRTLNILVHRYGTKNRTMSFDDFLMCTVKLKGMIDIFKESDPDGTNSATFTMDEWIINTIYS